MAGYNAGLSREQKRLVVQQQPPQQLEGMKGSNAGGSPTPTAQGRSIDELGIDTLQRVLGHLPPIALAHCSSVCSSWRDAITMRMWRKSILRHYPKPQGGGVRRVASNKNNNNKEEVKKWTTGDPGDSFRLAFADEEHKTRLAHGRPSIRSWKAHAGRVNGCRMTADQIVSCSSDRRIRVWCANTLKCLEQYQTSDSPGAPIMQVEFDESRVMGAAGQDVLIWSRRDNRRLLRRIVTHSDICSMCVEDSDVAVGCADGTVRLYDLYSSRCMQIFRMHSEPVKAVVVDVENKTMASGSIDGTVQLFDAQSGQKYASLLRPSSMTGITCLHLDADQMLYGGTRGGDVYYFDLRTRKIVWRKRVDGGALTCMHSPPYSTSTVGVGGIDGSVNIFSGHTAESLATFIARPLRLPKSPILGLAVGMTRLVSCHADSSMIMWELDESRSYSEGDNGPYRREEVMSVPLHSWI